MPLVPCLCPICNGKLRDKRTVRSHFKGYKNLQHATDLNDDITTENVSSTDLDTCGVTVTVSDSYSEQVTNVCNEAVNNRPLDYSSDSDNGVNEDAAEAIHNGHPFDNSSESDVGVNEDGVDSDSSTESIDHEEFVDERLQNCILRIIHNKVKHGWSQEETLSELRNIYEFTGNDNIPHQTWQAVIVFLKKLGYKNPRHYKICCGTDHVVLVEDEQCPFCGKIRKDCLDYFVLGLNLESIFLSDENIKRHLAHWEAKDEWLNMEQIQVPYHELWHGSRFRELSNFWDNETETILPTTCVNCSNVISTNEMAEAAGENNLSANCELNLSCQECGFSFVHKAKTMRGNPANQAFIFHEDGFNAFAKKSRGIAAIHVSHACMSKEERLHGDNLHVYSFIPTHQLKEGIPHKMDAFLKPLIEDIVKLYIEGIQVTIRTPVEVNNFVLPEGRHKVRALLLLGTADLKAHQEMILYAGGGKTGCRRCLVQGTYVPESRHYYYGSFGYKYRHPCDARTAAYQLHHGKRIEEAHTNAQRQQIQKETGVSGLSILFDLHRLYGFDPVHDMVIDRMHLSFNMLKKEFLSKMWLDLGDNAELPINDRSPENGGLLSRNDFSAAIKAVKWTTEQCASGVARLNSLTDKLGGWKSNEFKKFSTVAREVLAEKIPSKSYDCFMLVCDAVQMLYSKRLQRNGWEEQHIERVENLLWAHAIKAEEVYGLTMCTENLEYSVHIASDIRRHSSMDNYSCELYERAILRHKAQKHNCKGIEKTFAVRESLRNFLEDHQQKHGTISEYYTGQQLFRFNYAEAESPYYLQESSFKAGKDLLKTLSNHPQPDIQHARSQGVAIGRVKRKAFSASVVTDVRHYFQREGMEVNVPRNLLSAKSVALEDEVGEIEKFTKGTTCKIVACDNVTEWIMEITDIVVVGPVENKYFTFVNGKYFIPDRERGQVKMHHWTQTAKLVPREYVRDSVQPINRIRRKVIMFPDPSDLSHPGFHLCLDFKNPDFTSRVDVPVYPLVDDTVKILGGGQQVWYGKVTEVDNAARKATVRWYQETSRIGVWTLSRDEDQIFFASILGLCKSNRCFGGYQIV